MVESSRMDELHVLFIHCYNLWIPAGDQLRGMMKRWELTHLVDPQDTRVESRALILLKELKIDIHKVRRLERLHHPE